MCADQKWNAIHFFLPEKVLQILEVTLCKLPVVIPLLTKRVPGVFEILFLSKVDNRCTFHMGKGQWVLEYIQAQKELLSCNRNCYENLCFKIGTIDWFTILDDANPLNLGPGAEITGGG